jgi:hypothetical protein
VGSDNGFGNQVFSDSLFDKRHPRLRTFGYRKLRSILVGLCEGPNAELPRLFLNFGPTGVFSMCPRVGCGVIIGAIFYFLLYIAALG